MTAHVTAQQNTDPWAKAGVMMRASTDPGSPYYAVFVTPGQRDRGPVADRSGRLHQPAGDARHRPRLPDGRPVHHRRKQTYYTAYTSPDGSTWTAIPGSTVAISMTGSLLAGIAITSHNQGTGSAVTLNSVARHPGRADPARSLPGRMDLYRHRHGVSWSRRPEPVGQHLDRRGRRG